MTFSRSSAILILLGCFLGASCKTEYTEDIKVYPQLGHGDIISSVAFSSDGRYIVSGSWDMTVKLWDAETGRQIETFSGHTERVNSAAISPSGRLIVSASQDGTIRIWDVKTGRERGKINDRAFSVNFNNSDTTILAASTRGVKRWDIKKKRVIKISSGEASALALLSPASVTALSPDGRFIASASPDKTIKIINAGTGELIRSMGGWSDFPLMSAISHDGKFIASINTNRQIKFWNSETGQLIDSFEISELAHSLFFTPDNNGLMIVSPQGRVHTFSLKTGKLLNSIPACSDEPALLHTFSADGNSIISVLFNGDMHIYDFSKPQVTEIKRTDEELTSAVALSAGGRYIAQGFMDGKIRINDLASDTKTVFTKHKSRVSSLQFSPDGNYLSAGYFDGSVYVWNIPAASFRKGDGPVMKHASRVSSVSFSSDGDWLISSSRDNSTRIWDVKTGKEIASCIGFTDNEWIVITGDGYYNASLHGDEYLTVQVGDAFYGIDQFSAVFFQSEVVRARLTGKPDPAIVSTIGELRMDMVPPVIQIDAPKESETGSAKIRVSVQDRFNPVKNIQIVINGRLLGSEELSLFTENEKLMVENTRLVTTENTHEASFSINVDLEPGSNVIQVIAANNTPGKTLAPLSGVEGRKSVYIHNTSETERLKPDLWILAVGSNNYLYGKPETALKYAVNNAYGIKAAFEAQAGTRYQNIHSRIIADGEEIEPTRANILTSISEYFKKAKSHDVLILYLSGHGQDGKDGMKQYYFLPKDVPFDSNGEPDYSQAISMDDISALLDMPGRKFIFIDSCFSGGVDSRRLARGLKNQSAVIFTSSQENEQSSEGGGMVEYGIFTESLIRGIGGEAAVDKEVRLLGLSDYVYNNVQRNTRFSGRLQHPYINIPEGFYNLVLAEIP